MKTHETNASLLQCLSQFSCDLKLISCASVNVTHRELVTDALVIRQQQSLKGQTVAISLSDPVQLIKSICALDGVAAKMLLLPLTINLSIREQLEQQLGCTLRLDDNGWHSLSDVAKAASDEHTKWVIATSGTTGRPTLIEHSLASLSQSVKQPNSKYQDLIWGLIFEPYRFSGLQVMLQSLLAGNVLVVASELQPRDQIAQLRKEKVNVLCATPSWWRKMLIAGDEITQLQLRQITLGGEIADKIILSQLAQLFPCARVSHIYASTEAGVGFSVSDGQAGFPRKWLNNASLPTQIAINSDNHLLLKPSLLATGEEVLSRLDDRGFIDSCDLVKLTPDRVLFVGRDNGIINVGGNKIHPEQVELVIRGLTLVSDVYVYAKASSVLGQLVAADIVLADSTLDRKVAKGLIIKYCKEQLASYQVPMLLFFKDQLAISSNGKMIREKN